MFTWEKAPATVTQVTKKREEHSFFMILVMFTWRNASAASMQTHKCEKYDLFLLFDISMRKKAPTAAENIKQARQM